MVDLSLTVPVLHQSGKDADGSGWSAKDVCMNRDIAGPFEYRPGQTSCTTWYTCKEWSGRVVLVKRPWRPSKCKPRPVTELTNARGHGVPDSRQEGAGPPKEGFNPCLY